MESQTTDNEREYYSGLKCTNRARAAFDTCMRAGPPRRHAAPAAVLTVYGNSLALHLGPTEQKQQLGLVRRAPGAGRRGPSWSCPKNEQHSFWQRQRAKASSVHEGNRTSAAASARRQALLKTILKGGFT